MRPRFSWHYFTPDSTLRLTDVASNAFQIKVSIGHWGEAGAPRHLPSPSLRSENWGASRHVFSGLHEQIRAGAPIAVRGSVGTGDYDGIAVGIAHPAFPVVWPAVSIGRVAVAGHYDFDLHFLGALHHRVEVVDLEPEQHAIAVGPVTWIADAAVMVLHFEAVQLQNEGAILDQLL